MHAPERAPQTCFQITDHQGGTPRLKASHKSPQPGLPDWATFPFPIWQPLAAKAPQLGGGGCQIGQGGGKPVPIWQPCPPASHHKPLHY